MTRRARGQAGIVVDAQDFHSWAWDIAQGRKTKDEARAFFAAKGFTPELTKRTVIEQADEIISSGTLSGSGNRALTPQEQAFAKSVRDLYDNYRVKLDDRLEVARRAGNSEIITSLESLQDALEELRDDVRPVMQTLAAAGGNVALRETGLELFAWVQRPEVQQAIDRAAFFFAQKHGAAVVEDMRALLGLGLAEGDSIPQLKKRIHNQFDEWKDWRAERVARTESVDKVNMGKELAYQSTDGIISAKVWDAAGDACPFCLAMHDKVMSLGQPFHRVGESFTVQWNGPKGVVPLTMTFNYKDVSHPPIHPNCRCTIRAQVTNIVS